MRWPGRGGKMPTAVVERPRPRAGSLLLGTMVDGERRGRRGRSQAPMTVTGRGRRSWHAARSRAMVGAAALTLALALAGGEAEGAAAAVPVEISESEIDLPLADVLAAPHAINVHQSADNIEEY